MTISVDDVIVDENSKSSQTKAEVEHFTSYIPRHTIPRQPIKTWDMVMNHCPNNDDELLSKQDIVELS